MNLQTNHKGSKWLLLMGYSLSPLGITVADILGVVFQGIYHIPEKKLCTVTWQNEDIMRLNISMDLATYDSGHLTWLIVLCHDRCIRLKIQPRANNYLTLVFSHRNRTGHTFERMPTMEEHLKIIRDSVSYKEAFGAYEQPTTTQNTV